MSKLIVLDLSMIKQKLCEPYPEGKGWTMEFANRIEGMYKAFLFLTATTKDHPIVPTTTIDQMWHQHILDTRAYAQDCDHVFGEFLHHFPYFGLRGEEDYEALRDSFKHTRKTYQAHFGAEYGAHAPSLEELVRASK